MSGLGGWQAGLKDHTLLTIFPEAASHPKFIAAVRDGRAQCECDRMQIGTLIPGRDALE
ncbi:hypothetical protein OCAR_6964 [Afipia carboxidovorans OM5]|nr:hypothetical protein OCAR_6964 [Afipia carboxidovorans OM5]